MSVGLYFGAAPDGARCSSCGMAPHAPDRFCSGPLGEVLSARTLSVTVETRADKLARDIAELRERLASHELRARTAAPRSRFAYASAATKVRARLARAERELSEVYGREVSA